MLLKVSFFKSFAFDFEYLFGLLFFDRVIQDSLFSY